MKTTRRKSAAPFYAAAAVWLAYALVLPLYEPLHYALAAGASLLAFAAASALCRGGPAGEEAGEAPPEKAEEPAEKNRPPLAIRSWTRWPATGSWPSGR